MTRIDRLLEERRHGDPLRVAVAGIGAAGHGLVNQIINSVPGMDLAAIAATDPENALAALVDAGIDNAAVVESVRGVRRSMYHGITAVTDDFSAITDADGIDVVIDMTGTVESGCLLALSCFRAGKHLVSTNPAVDGTVGGELGRLADSAGVVFTGSRGDRPGAQMNLIRFVRRIGLTPLVSGTIADMWDPYRNPTTEQRCARRRDLNPRLLAAVADGTRMALEQAIVGNAAGMSVHRRGMLGRHHVGHVDDLRQHYDVDRLRALGGAVDYVIGAKPTSGVYCFGAHDDLRQQRYLELYQLGSGPLYSFYTPYHLRHFEIPVTAARTVLMGDAAVRALAVRHLEAVTTAKIDLKAGTVLDGIGGYHYYGEVEKSRVAREQRLLPIGAAEGCRLNRDVPTDAVLTYGDVTLPSGRLVDQLLEAQANLPVSEAEALSPRQT